VLAVATRASAGTIHGELPCPQARQMRLILAESDRAGPSRNGPVDPTYWQSLVAVTRQCGCQCHGERDGGGDATARPGPIGDSRLDGARGSRGLRAPKPAHPMCILAASSGH
jgi:hypothetical protein